MPAIRAGTNLTLVFGTIMKINVNTNHIRVYDNVVARTLSTMSNLSRNGMPDEMLGNSETVKTACNYKKDGC
jgi:hypothetical protein